jgi:hypothetical protein
MLALSPGSSSAPSIATQAHSESFGDVGDADALDDFGDRHTLRRGRVPSWIRRAISFSGMSNFAPILTLDTSPAYAFFRSVHTLIPSRFAACLMGIKLSIMA